MKISIVPFDKTPSYRHVNEERYRQGYLWTDVYFDEETAKHADQEGEDFRRGISWYAGMRWMHDEHRNGYLDELIDSGEFKPDEVSKKEYQLYYRTWIKRLRFYAW